MQTIYPKSRCRKLYLTINFITYISQQSEAHRINITLSYLAKWSSYYINNVLLEDFSHYLSVCDNGNIFANKIVKHIHSFL